MLRPRQIVYKAVSQCLPNAWDYNAQAIHNDLALGPEIHFFQLMFVMLFRYSTMSIYFVVPFLVYINLDNPINIFNFRVVSINIVYFV